MRRQEKPTYCLKEPSSKLFSSTASTGSSRALSSACSQPTFIPTTASTCSFRQDRSCWAKPRRWTPSVRHVWPSSSIACSCPTAIPSALINSKGSTKSVTPVSEIKSTTTISASAQFGVGIVYDPTNYSNALLRYYQLQQHLLQLRASYAQLVAQYNFAVRMAKNIQNMPARYRAQFSQWRNTSSSNTYGNTGTWVNGINSGQPGFASTGYQQATTQLLTYNQNQLSGMNADELARVRSQYATVELADGANSAAIAT